MNRVIAVAMILFSVPAVANPNLNAMLAEGDADEAANLCDRASPLEFGSSAPCTGILWGIGQTRSALICIQARLPECENDYTLLQRESTARINTLQLMLNDAEDRLKSSDTNNYVLLSVAIGSVTVGLITGFFLFRK